MRTNSKGPVKTQTPAKKPPRDEIFEYDNSSEERQYSDEVLRSNNNSNNTKVKDDGFDDDEMDEEEVTPAYLEQSLITTIKEFGTFVASITRDLEQQEMEEIEALKAKGKKTPKLRWADSTFKVELTQGLLLKFFETKADRLMKYYIVILLPMKKWITKRREKFFLKAQIFPGAPEEDIRFFRDLWGVEGAMTPKEKQTSWDYWDTQIEIVEDWHRLTGWKVDPKEKLNIPNVDYAKAARDAQISDSDE